MKLDKKTNMRHLRNFVTIIILIVFGFSSTFLILDTKKIIRLKGWYGGIVGGKRGRIPFWDYIVYYATLLNTWIFVLSVLLLIVVFYFWWGKEKKCPQCGKRFHLKKVDIRQIGVQDRNIQVENEVTDLNGRVWGKSEQYVRGKRRTYERIYRCKKCGYEFGKSFTKDTVN